MQVSPNVLSIAHANLYSNLELSSSNWKEIHTASEKIHPAQKLFNVLLERNIIDNYGRMLPHIRYNFELNFKEFENRMKEFLQKPIPLKIRDLEGYHTVSITLYELFKHLQMIEPAIGIEIFKNGGIYFLGFDFIDNLYKSWGIDLVEVCGRDYVEQLRQELNQVPSHLEIIYFVKNAHFQCVDKLVHEVLNFIGHRIHEKEQQEKISLKNNIVMGIV